MSLYGAIFGRNESAGPLLYLAGYIATDRLGRLRDVWLERGDDGEPRIAVYTRNGGGNREECWCTGWAHPDPDEAYAEGACPCCGTGGPACSCPACCANHRMPENPLHLYGEDDEFDCTYRTEFFRVRPDIPDELRAALREGAGEQVDTDQRWLDAIAAIGGPR